MNIKRLFEDDDAVSPVIGVILMVAITVILAAVIGTFVLGLGENVSKNAQAGVSFDQDSTTVSVQLTSEGNVDPGQIEILGSGACDGDPPADPFSQVGDTVDINCGGTDGKLTVKATIDGSSNVIATYELN